MRCTRWKTETGIIHSKHTHTLYPKPNRTNEFSFSFLKCVITDGDIPFGPIVWWYSSSHRRLALSLSLSLAHFFLCVWSMIICASAHFQFAQIKVSGCFMDFGNDASSILRKRRYLLPCSRLYRTFQEFFWWRWNEFSVSSFLCIFLFACRLSYTNTILLTIRFGFVLIFDELFFCIHPFNEPDQTWNRLNLFRICFWFTSISNLSKNTNEFRH